MAKRTTQHNGRKNKNGAYSPKHMDRNTNTKNPTWDPERSKNNVYWNIYDGIYTGQDKIDKGIQPIEEAEKRFYAENYQGALDLQNENAKKNKNKQHDMDHYRTSVKTCPEEQICCIGNKDDHATAKTLWDAFQEQVAWEQEHYPVRYISIALHVDEYGTPHIHSRRVWEYTNEQGIKCIGQKEALRQYGIERPDPNKPESRNNNAKVTYTKDCREHFQQICKEYCLEIETTPKDRSEVGLSLIEYQARQEEQKLKEIQQKQEIENLAYEQQQMRQQQQIAIIEAEKQKAEAAKRQAIEDRDIIKAEADEAIINKNQAEIDLQKSKIEISKNSERIEKQDKIIQNNKGIIEKQANQYYAFKGIVSQVNEDPKKFMEAHEHHFRDKDNITVNRANYYRTEGLVQDLHKGMSQLTQAIKSAPAEYGKLQQEKPKIEAEKAKLQRDKDNFEKEKSAYHQTVNKAVKEQTEKEVAAITDTLNKKALAKFGITPEQYKEALDLVKMERNRGISR